MELNRAERRRLAPIFKKLDHGITKGLPLGYSLYDLKYCKDCSSFHGHLSGIGGQDFWLHITMAAPNYGAVILSIPYENGTMACGNVIQIDGDYSRALAMIISMAETIVPKKTIH